MIKSLVQKFKIFYNASPENRIGFYNFLAFVIVPFVGMSTLFIIVYFFVI